MKEYSAKTIDEAVALAAQELGVEVDAVIYEVLEEKKGIFSKKATIQVYELSEVVDYAQDYLKNVIESLGITGVGTTAYMQEDIIRIEIESDHNPVLIGKNGNTLRSLNEITRLAVSGKFRQRYRILLDVGDYKDGKYSRIASIARRSAKQVQKTKMPVTLDPMPSDERRVVHNVLNKFSHIKTESSGDGHKRAVTIKYVD